MYKTRMVACLTLMLAFAISPSESYPDQEAWPEPYVISSRNRRYYFKMEPKDHSGYPVAGGSVRISNHNWKGTAYDSWKKKDEQEIWEVEGWYSFSVYLSDDGRSLVRLGLWPRGGQPSTGDLAVAFYRDGKLINQYSTAELIGDHSKVTPSVTHYQFHRRITVWGLIKDRNVSSPRARFTEMPILIDNLFYLLTADNIEYEFDIATGEIKNKRYLEIK